MQYKCIVKTDKNLVISYLLSIGLLAGGIAFFINSLKFIGILCCITGLFILYTISKVRKYIKASGITTYTDGLTIAYANGYKISFNWDGITHAGKIINGEYKDSIFIYDNNEDKYVQLLTTYEDFDAFVDELKEHIEVKDVTLEENQAVKDYLKQIIS